MRDILALICLVICIVGGCEHSQTQENASELSEEFEALMKRVEELEQQREPNPIRDDSAKVQVDNTGADAVFADATHVVAAGRNVLIDFGTRRYGSGEPSEARTQLSIYMNYYTAKRLHAALAMSLQRHTSVFGEVQVDDAATIQPATHDGNTAIYANFVRLTGTPEELIVDLGLSQNRVGIPTEPIPIAYIVMMDYQTASTFFRQVGTLIGAYESKNGPIETDIQRRVVN